MHVATSSNSPHRISNSRTRLAAQSKTIQRRQHSAMIHSGTTVARVKSSLQRTKGGFWSRQASDKAMGGVVGRVDMCEVRIVKVSRDLCMKPGGLGRANWAYLDGNAPAKVTKIPRSTDTVSQRDLQHLSRGPRLDGYDRSVSEYQAERPPIISTPWQLPSAVGDTIASLDT